MQITKIVTNTDGHEKSRLFIKEMIKTLLKQNLSKTEIMAQTGLSLATVNRILLGKHKKLTPQNCKKLLYFYCCVNPMK